MIDRIVSFFGIASGDPKLYPRHVHLVDAKTGWRGFMDKYVRPQLDLGVRRFLFWMPFGQDELRDHHVAGRTFKSRVRFDQWQQALSHQRDLPNGQRWMTEGFVEETRKLTDAGCQVIGYTGTFPGSPEYDCASGLQRRAYVEQSLSPFLAAGCDVAFDSAVRAPAWHPLRRITHELRNRNVRVYVEAMPYNATTYGDPIWADADVIADESMYLAAVADTQQKLFVHPTQIRGEIVRGFWAAPPAPWSAAGKLDWAGWYRARVPGALHDGHSVCLQLRAFVGQGGQIGELVE